MARSSVRCLGAVGEPRLARTQGALEQHDLALGDLRSAHSAATIRVPETRAEHVMGDLRPGHSAGSETRAEQRAVSAAALRMPETRAEHKDGRPSVRPLGGVRDPRRTRVELAEMLTLLRLRAEGAARTAAASTRP
jgi:hypothetical protein